MSRRLSTDSSLRIFAFSIVASAAILLAVLFGINSAALLTTLVLAVVELTFSFDNAIINAKVLGRVSRRWQMVFLSVGIVVAIFGMRVLFPVIIVSVTAHLGWGKVVDLALRHPHQYAHHLEQAHTAISAFGGAFLLLLALQFFFDGGREVLWLQRLEAGFQKLSHWLWAPLITLLAVLAIAWLPANHHQSETVSAGVIGAATYLAVQLLVRLLERRQPRSHAAQGGWAAVGTLVYLEILDASFSFDGVIGAFAITSNVLLIAAGLGIGALWVRSLTVYMVRRRTLDQFIYLEHGAHYTVLALAILLLVGIVINISDFVPGVMGIVIIAAAVAASLQARRNSI